LTWLSRYGLLLLAGLGALLLVVAEFSTLYEVVAITAVVPGGTSTVGENHLYAQLLLAVFAVLMAWGAFVGGSRPAAFAVVLVGAVSLFIVLVVDLPDVSDEGLLAETYESAKASPRTGFYLEAIGAVLVLLAGAAAVLLGAATRTREPRPRRRRDRPAPESEPEPPAGAEVAAES
jgi:hypothetical protein